MSLSPNNSTFRPAALEQYLRFEAFTALAFGSKAIQYWAYATRPNSIDNATGLPNAAYFTGLTNRQNKKTAAWYYAKTINREILKFQDIFLKGKLVSVDSYSQFKYFSTNGQFVIFADQEFIVSQFLLNGTIYIVVVNKDVLNYLNLNIEVTINPLTSYVVTELTPIKSGGKENTALNSGAATRILIPGGYRIFKCEH